MASATEASMADYCYKDRMFALLVDGKIAKRSAVDFRRLWGSGFEF